MPLFFASHLLASVAWKAKLAGRRRVGTAHRPEASTGGRCPPYFSLLCNAESSLRDSGHVDLAVLNNCRFASDRPSSRRRFIAGLGEQRLDLGPEGPAAFLLVRGEPGQRGLVADTGEVGVNLPVLEGLPNGRASWGGPLSRPLAQTTRSALSQSRASVRQRALAASSAAGPSLPLPLPASAAAQAALYRLPAFRSSARLGSVLNTSCQKRAEAPYR